MAKQRLPGCPAVFERLRTSGRVSFRGLTGFFVSRLSMFLVILVLLTLTTGPSIAQDIRLEAEALIDSGDNGLEPITVVTCNVASGGLAVDGVDATGDWITLDLPLDAPFCFQSAIQSAGALTLVRVFEVSVASVPGNSPLFADTLITMPGSGVG